MSRKNKIKTVVALSLAVVLAALLGVAIWQNKALQLNTVSVSYGWLPPELDGYRIAHISDLHNTEIGEDNRTLIEMLEAARPDMIAMTGDMIDASRTDIDVVLRFASEATRIAPCFFVTGNHEVRADSYPQLRKGLEEVGVTVLENASATLEKNGERITVIGVNDPINVEDKHSDDYAVMEGYLQKATEGVEEDGTLKILLAHRPELLALYAEFGINLVLSGHTHGGQFRLPFIGGVVAPDQGLFPKYDAGLYELGKTQMVVSRGIGNSIIPLRINNPPEVVLVELACAE